MQTAECVLRMACDIVSKTVQVHAEQENNFGGHMVACLYSSLLNNSCCLYFIYVAFVLCVCRN